MKNCICCLSLLVLSSLVACSDLETRESTEQTEVKTIDSATRLGEIKELTTTVGLDSVMEVKAVEEKKKAHLQLAKETTKALKKAYEEREKATESYAESIPFTAFLGNPIESGALEIIEFGDQYTRVYADYFDGEPIGGKLFFVQNNALVAIEIIQLKEQITEKGASIQEKSTHILYYHDKILLSTIDLSTNEVVEAGSIAWLDENIVDWELVKAHINRI